MNRSAAKNKLVISINASLAVQLIEDYLSDLVKSNKSAGILLGLSGGVDSSVLATIAVNAIGKDNVHVSFLFDRDSEKSSAKNAELMADWLGLRLETEDITSVMQKKRVYAPLIMKLVPYSARFNRMIQHTYLLVTGEKPFKSSLKVGSHAFEKSWLKHLMFNLTIRHIDKGFSERHIYRRNVLEKKAEKENLTLIGAANRSEFEVGWFVKDGIDDLPIQPMTGLYKTQVWQLASFLKLPAVIQSQPPSPDMMFGITDEFGIGHPYRRLDIVLDLLERKKTRDEIIDHGISKKELDDILDLMKYSAWKRTSRHEPPPVDGAIGGNVRLHNESLDSNEEIT
jgi:NAD+ synthase